MGVKIYDANEVTVNIGGVDIDSGFADGEFVKVEQEEQFSTYTGSDGEVTRSKTNQKTARLTVLLGQSSNGNAALSTLIAADLNASNGAGVVAVMIRDRQGLSIFSSDAAWLVKHPDESFDREATAREWILDAVTNGASRFVGGN